MFNCAVYIFSQDLLLLKVMRFKQESTKEYIL